MRELLVFTPFNLMLGSTIVIVMSGGRSVTEGFSVTNFLGLREPGSCWLSPSVVVLKEFVIEMVLNLGLRMGDLVKSGRDIALLVKVTRADLGDMQVDHIAVISVDIHEFILSQFFNREEFLHGDVLVR